MLVRLSLLALCATLAAAPAFAKDKGEPFACAGVFGPDSSAAILIDQYGADNVVTGDVPGPEGDTMLATTVFPNDPDKTMQFGWWDEANLKDLSYVDLPAGMAGPQGVRIGMTVAEVEKLNGEPFTIGGFWWDYGGYANIETGALANTDGGCYLSLRFSPTAEYPQDLDVSTVSGEVIIPSSEPLLAKLDTRVQVVSISYAGPEGDQ